MLLKIMYAKNSIRDIKLKIIPKILTETAERTKGKTLFNEIKTNS